MVHELIRVVYIWSSLLQLTRDLSQAEKKILLLQAEQSHKMATVFTFSEKVVTLSEKCCQFVNVRSLQQKYF